MNSSRALYSFPSDSSYEAEEVLLPSACQRYVTTYVVALSAFESADLVA